MIGVREVDYQPYKGLWISVVLQAIDDAQKADRLEREVLAGAKEPYGFGRALRHGRSAKHWINSRANGGINSFEFICDVFKLNKVRIRGLVNKG